MELSFRQKLVKPDNAFGLHASFLIPGQQARPLTLHSLKEWPQREERRKVLNLNEDLLN